VEYVVITSRLGKDIWGLALYPFIFIQKDIIGNEKQYLRILNHERIHHAQQIELLIIPFYLWYFLEYGYYYIKTRNAHRAYLSIRFERECNKHEMDLNYLAKRRPYNYLFPQRKAGKGHRRKHA
jgi:hypothetical protein